MQLGKTTLKIHIGEIQIRKIQTWKQVEQYKSKNTHRKMQTIKDKFEHTSERQYKSEKIRSEKYKPENTIRIHNSENTNRKNTIRFGKYNSGNPIRKLQFVKLYSGNSEK